MQSIANILSFTNVFFAYNANAQTPPNSDNLSPILDGVSFDIKQGEFVALMGKNGSGKSTIAKMADAFLLPSSGSVTANGQDIAKIAEAGTDALLRFRCDIGFVQQNPDNQFVATRVIDEVAFGPSGLGISKDEVLDRVNEALSQVGALDLADRDVNTLSGGQKQRIAIADALAMRPKIFIFDEPTSMLDESGKTEVMQIIHNLHKSGTTILLITHSVEEALHADRILEIAKGQITEPDDVRSIEDKAFDHVYKLAESQTTKQQGQKTLETIIDFREVSFEYDDTNDLVNGIMGIPPRVHPVFMNLDLKVYARELLCITGPNGSGKSTLAALMNGLLRPSSGEVRVFDVPTSSRSGANAARRHVGVCFQYPERNFFCQNVLEEVAFGPKRTGLSKDEAQAAAVQALSAVGINSETIMQSSPFDISGGMQRKVAFASILSMKPDVLVADEPCAGLDIDSHAEFIELMLHLKLSGLAIVMITHDKRDIKILADRVHFMR